MKFQNQKITEKSSVIKKNVLGVGYSSVVKHVLSMYEVLGSISSTSFKKKKCFNQETFSSSKILHGRLNM